MRKTGIICLLIGIFILCFSPAVLAASDPHGDYTASTAACALCHGTHNANSPDLVNAPSGSANYVYRLCVYCHDGSQSKYDEVDGAVKTSDGQMFPTDAGGFSNMVTLGGPQNVATTQTVTSEHIVDNSDTQISVQIPGSNPNETTSLSCVSCHDPHGSANGRLLVFAVLMDDGTTDSTITTGSPSTGNTVSFTTSITINVSNTTTPETVSYDDTISNFCISCHTGYTKDGQGTHPVAINGFPLAVSSSSGFNSANFALPTSDSNDITCLTCHYAHGSTTIRGPSNTGNSLLRMDNDGVCQDCHNESPPATPSPPVLETAKSYLTSDGAGTSYIVLTFSTYMNASTAQDTSNYIVSSGNNTIAGATLEPNGLLGKQVLLKLASPVLTSTTIQVSSLKDLNGTSLVATSITLNP